MKIYTCPICNKTFTNPQAFNGHKSGHNPLNTVKMLEANAKRYKERYAKSVEEYLLNPAKCVQCGKDLPYEKRRGYKFCGHVCSAKHSNKHGNRSSTKGKTKQAKCTVCGIDMLISLSACDKKTKCKACKIYKKSNKIIQQTCQVCGNIFYKRHIVKACSNECLFILRSNCGKRSATSQFEIRRSKNEIHFAELCKTVYKEVLTNVPMFNSWDADVILPNEKIAVLWNGMWHHKKCAKKHSLEQTQSRDKIKRHEIENAGYICYVIDDFGKANPSFVIQEFEKFKEKHPPIL
jgi:hypothetical protein